MESRWFSVTFVDAENWLGYVNVCCHHKNIKGEAMSITNKMIIALLLSLARREARAGNVSRAIQLLDDVVDVYEMEGET